MAQHKKDSIKDSIDKAALEVFAKKGYKGTKISDISDFSSISVGNIYRYYKSKEEIFYNIVSVDFLEIVRELLYKKIKAAGREGFWLINEEVLAFLTQNRLAVRIVLGNNEGTRYENARQELIEFMVAAVKETEGRTAAEDLILRCIYTSLVDGTLKVLESSEDAEAVRATLSQLHTYHLFGMTGILKGE